MKALCFLSHQEIFDKAVCHLFSQSPGAYRGYCGGCPVGNFIAPGDYMTAMEGVPVLFVGAAASVAPSYMEVTIRALKRALLRSRINVYDPLTVELLSCLQNAHDVLGKWEWRDRLESIACQFGLCADLLEHAA